MYRFSENRGIRKAESTTKKGHQKFLADETFDILEKLETFSQTLKCSEKRGEI